MRAACFCNIQLQLQAWRECVLPARGRRLRRLVQGWCALQ
jgi:hypothetical protein